MKLTGSLVEKQYRNELITSRDDLSKNKNQLFVLLEKTLSPINSALTLNWTPEQLEDIYTILVNGQYVITLEIPKNPNILPTITSETKAEYERSLTSKHKRIQLAVALDLSNELLTKS